MKSFSATVAMAFVVSCFMMALSGCASSPVQQADVCSTQNVSLRPETVGEEEIAPLFRRVAQWQARAQDALEAAKSVGTANRELLDAQQRFSAAEQWRERGKSAYYLKRYAESRESLQTAEKAFRQAEQAAVRVGLAQLERDINKGYHRFLTSGAKTGPL